MIKLKQNFLNLNRKYFQRKSQDVGISEVGFLIIYLFNIGWFALYFGYQSNLLIEQNFAKILFFREDVPLETKVHKKAPWSAEQLRLLPFAAITVHFGINLEECHILTT